MHIVSRVGIGKVPPSSPLYLDVGGAVNFDNTLHVIGQTTVNSLISSQLAIDSIIYESRIPGDTNVLFCIHRNGMFEWGSGGSNIIDVNLYRSNVNALTTNGSLIIEHSLSVGVSAADIAIFTARIASNLDPSSNNLFNLGQDTLRWQNLWLGTKLTSLDGLFSGDLQVDGNTIIGNSFVNTIALNSRVSTSVIPSVDNINNLGSLDQRWASLWLGSNLQVDGNTIIGDTYTDIIALNSRVSTSVIPSVDNINNLGSLDQRWASLWLGSNLQVDGNTIIGDSPSDTLTINAGFASPVNPSIDNIYDIGTFDFRWKQIHSGPAGVVIRNDNTDTDKVFLYFNSGVATLQSSDGVHLRMTTASNNGILVDNFGKVGINTSSVLSENFTVNGTSDFLDTTYFSKPVGYGLQVESIAGIKGSIESANLQKQLNIGTGSETEFVNLGTGPLTKTVNIGTGLGKTTINIGGPSDIININGTVATTQTIESFVTDKTFTLNVGGLNSTGQNSGLLIEEAEASFLTVSDPTWQSGNTVRYLATSTGNIKIGSVILIAGFSNPQNNGQFTVTDISVDSYFEIQNAAIVDSSFDEINFGQSTNPTIVGKIVISSDRNGWEIYSPSYPSNFIKISNEGGNAELKGIVSGLAVNAPALIPEITLTPLGSITNLWNGFFNDVSVYNNTIIGENSSNTLIINASSSFVGPIDSDILPNVNKNLGSLAQEWSSVYAKNMYASTDLTVDGIIKLGTSESTIIEANGLFQTSLIPLTDDYNLGSQTSPWNELYVNTLAFPELSPGSVLFIDESISRRITENNSNFFWENNYKRFSIGLNNPDYVLDIKKYESNAIRLRNSQNNSALAFKTKETVFNIVSLIENGPELIEATSISFNETNTRVAQTFELLTTKNIQKVAIQIAATAPTTIPALSGKIFVSICPFVGGAILDPIATSKPLILDGYPLGFLPTFSDFEFYELQTLSAGFYALVIDVFETPGLLPPEEPSYIHNCIRVLTKEGTSYASGDAYIRDATDGWYIVSPAEDLSFKIYEYADSGVFVKNKIEFTESIEFGVNSYANVGSGSSSPILELTSTQVKLLGAVSVNSVSVGLATYVVQPTDVIINVDTMSSGCTITLPSAATKRLLVIKDIGNNASVTGRSIQISPASNEYVEFNLINTAYVLDRDGESVTLQSDGVNRWYII